MAVTVLCLCQVRTCVILLSKGAGSMQDSANQINLLPFFGGGTKWKVQETHSSHN